MVHSGLLVNGTGSTTKISYCLEASGAVTVEKPQPLPVAITGGESICIVFPFAGLAKTQASVTRELLSWHVCSGGQSHRFHPAQGTPTWSEGKTHLITRA